MADDIFLATHRATYERDGFVALRSFIPGDELRDLISRVERFVDQVVPTMPRERVFYEDMSDGATLKQIQHMDEYDDWFHHFFVAGRIRSLAELLLGTAVVPKNLQYFNKPATVGLPTPAHQDGFYFMLDPCVAVTLWLALDDVDEQNGCVRYVRGSHRRGMREHRRTQTLGFSQGIADYPTDSDRQQEVAIPAQGGDLLAHDAMTIHRADGNRSANRDRRALGFIFYSDQAREDQQAQADYQRRLAEELKSAGKL